MASQQQPPHKPSAHAQAERYRAVLDASALPTFILTSEFRVERVNPAGESLLGWSGQEIDALASTVPSGREDEERELERRLQAGERVEGFVTRRVCKDGNEIPVAVHGRRLEEAAGGGYAVSFVDLRERERETREALVLAEFVQATTTAGSERDVLDALAQRVSDAVEGSLAIYRLDKAAGELEVLTIRSHDEIADAFRAMYARQRWRLGEGFMGAAIEGGVTVFRAYLTPPEREAYLATLPEDRRPEMAARDLRAIIAVPLKEDHSRLGVLTLARYGAAAEPFSDADRRFTEELAARASIALTRIGAAARRERDGERQRLLAEFLAAAVQATDEHAIFEQLATRSAGALGAVCVIYRATPDRQELEPVGYAGYEAAPTDAVAATFAARRWRADEGVAGAAYTTGETIVRPYIDAVDQAVYLAGLPQEHSRALATFDIRAAIGVPLNAGDARIGSLTLSRYGQAALPFDEDDGRFAEAAAAHASVALGRLSLQAAREQTARILETVFDASPLATQLLDGDGNVLLWNPAAERLFGFSADEAIGGRPPTIPPEEVPAALDLAHRVQRGEVVEALPARRLRKDGSMIDVLLYGASVPDEPGETRILGIYADVTERNRLEREVARTSETLRAILDASPLAIVATDVDRRVTYWNRAAETFYGWRADEVLGGDPPMLIPGEPDPFAPDLPRILAGESVTHDDVPRRTKSGEVVSVRLFGAPVHSPDGAVVGMIGIHEDLRELRELQEHLRETSDTLAAILDSSPLPIIAVDEARRITFWNGAAQRLYGWRADEVVGRVAPFTPDDESETQQATFGRILSGEGVDTEVRRRTKDGRVLEIHVHASPLRDEHGRIRGGLSVHEDVTERKHLEAQLLQAQKMETVGRLAGGVAHDFNNILTAIIGYSEIAQGLVREDEARRAIATIKSSAERAAGLTQQLLAFSRRQMLQPKLISANDVIHRTESLLRRLIGEDIELIISMTPKVGSVLVDPTQLEQVVLNLALNARDAMPSGGRLAIRTERLHVNGEHPHLEMPTGDYVVISVADTGVGMDDETKAHIFEPFFTTKPVGQGTGLGLATVYGIVRQSGGYIWVYSEPGHGTTFRLYFPRVGPAQEVVAEVEALRPGTRGGRVLLVEDEPVLRDLARLVLSRAGLEVVSAQDPDEALQIADDEEPFDLLLTDVVMPGSTGVELARRLRASRPDLRVIFMSGYAEEVTAASTVRSRYLAKPFTPTSLLRVVDEALAEASEVPRRPTDRSAGHSDRRRRSDHRAR